MGGETWCLQCGKNLMLCMCDAFGDQDKMPTLDNLPAEPTTMTHADHYFRFASIMRNKYCKRWDIFKWIGDYGGFLTSVLKANRSRLLEVARTFVIDLETAPGLGSLVALGEIPQATQRYLRKGQPPLKIPDRLAAQTKTGIRQYVIRAITSVLDGKLSHVTSVDISWVCQLLQAPEASDIELVQKQLLMKTLYCFFQQQWLDKMFSLSCIAVDHTRTYHIVFQ
ncbi:hypothetical protein WJX74_002094 [Apatococcus lobatus]|uniref:Uncharacterized protein n=1 Tax=Apatococcus lobatus TaxID=904363 RepID=A0AAW1QZK5_9CHLO